MSERSPGSRRNGALYTRGIDCLHSCQISTAPHAEFYEMFALLSSSKRPRRRLSGLLDWLERLWSNFRLSRRRRVPSLENRLLLNFSDCKKLGNKYDTIKDGVDLRKQLEWGKMLFLSDG